MGATMCYSCIILPEDPFSFLETLCESQGAPWRRARHEVWNETVATLTLMALGPRDLGMVMVMGRSICGWYGGSDIRAVE